MAHTENLLSILNKDDLICLALGYQQKYDTTLDKISKELAEVHKSYIKSESDLAITKAVNFQKLRKYLEYQKILTMVS